MCKRREKRLSDYLEEQLIGALIHELTPSPVDQETPNRLLRIVSKLKTQLPQLPLKHEIQYLLSK